MGRGGPGANGAPAGQNHLLDRGNRPQTGGAQGGPADVAGSGGPPGTGGPGGGMRMGGAE